MQNQNLEKAVLDSAESLINLAFREDLGTTGDITTHAILADDPADRRTAAHAVIIAKSPGTIAGLKIFALVFAKLTPAVQLYLFVDDKDSLAPKQEIVRLYGPVITILNGERVALNFLQRLSGIATLTRKFVNAVAGTKAKILDTRKTTPGWRMLEKYAVQCGGGFNHRLGLHDMFLIKENHIAAAGSIAAAVKKCRALNQRRGWNWNLEVEARTLAHVEECLRLGVEHIMLDNMSIAAMHNAVQLTAGRAKLEASGNISLENVAAIAATGVDYISIGALTHSAPAMDFSLLIL
ncbi:MAG: putative nicotinate-nucleotide pyrophosphorylase [carboxylating] [bacterium]|nr:putative nicotinate-nucleotide pyrophosphorylase [carboxylating] [bacterium]